MRIEEAGVRNNDAVRVGGRRSPSFEAGLFTNRAAAPDPASRGSVWFSSKVPSTSLAGPHSTTRSNPARQAVIALKGLLHTLQISSHLAATRSSPLSPARFPPHLFPPQSQPCPPLRRAKRPSQKTKPSSTTASSVSGAQQHRLACSLRACWLRAGSGALRSMRSRMSCWRVLDS